MSEKKNPRIRRIVLVILISSFLLRMILIFSGGQYFFPDEVRYNVSHGAAHALWNGNTVAFWWILNSADHFLFKVIGILPATLENIFGLNAKIPALFFSLFSIASLWLIWKIMLRAGENERAALLAVSLLALCSTYLYYSRHLLPYDMAMTFGLLAIFTGIHKPSRAVDSILCGLFSACCFLTYNGYWILGGFAMLAHIMRPPHMFAETVRRAFISVMSLATPILLILAISAAAGGDLLGEFLRFSRTVTQGTFSEGWMLPVAYFWHSEHLIALLWVVALLFGLWDLAVGSRKESVVLAVSGIIFIYGTLVIFSVFLEKFVVYGRLARQMLPFFCILTALFLDRMWISPPKRKFLVTVVLLIVVCQAVFNFHKPFTQIFPKKFLRLASKVSKQKFPRNSRQLWSDAAVTTETEEYKVLYAHYIYPEPQPTTDSGRIIFQKRHPQQYLPYQYEGFTPNQRSKLQSIDISMRLVLKEKPVILSLGKASNNLINTDLATK